MVFKLDYEKVAEVGTSLVGKAEELNSLYSDVINISQLMDDCWMSEDSSIYISHFVDYIKMKKIENELFYGASRTLKDISLMYAEQDEKGLRNLVQKDFSREE